MFLVIPLVAFSVDSSGAVTDRTTQHTTMTQYARGIGSVKNAAIARPLEATINQTPR
jgi:hypothetical protein